MKSKITEYQNPGNAVTKSIKISFWISMFIIVIMVAIIPAFTSQTEFVKEGMRHFSYPGYVGDDFVTLPGFLYYSF